ncbi:hypothetical protein GCM10010495_03930 [Kitasatospora herbaricolor]|nr:hypothetical protein GCM10010495_03930 [Kitasatospora herbaricolor]
MAPPALVRYCAVRESVAAEAGTVTRAAQARPAAVQTAIAVRARAGMRSRADTLIPSEWGLCGTTAGWSTAV